MTGPERVYPLGADPGSCRRAAGRYRRRAERGHRPGGSRRAARAARRRGERRRAARPGAAPSRPGGPGGPLAGGPRATALPPPGGHLDRLLSVVANEDAALLVCGVGARGRRRAMSDAALVLVGALLVAGVGRQRAGGAR